MSESNIEWAKLLQDKHHVGQTSSGINIKLAKIQIEETFSEIKNRLKPTKKDKHPMLQTPSGKNTKWYKHKVLHTPSCRNTK